MAGVTRKEQLANGVALTPLTREEVKLAGGTIVPLTEKERFQNAAFGGKAPEGKISITANGTDIDVSAYALADVAVPASAVVSGTKSITANGTVDVSEFAEADVDVIASSPYIEIQINEGLSLGGYITGPFGTVNSSDVYCFGGQAIALSAGEAKKVIIPRLYTGNTGGVICIKRSTLNALPEGKKVTVSKVSGYGSVYLDEVQNTGGQVFTGYMQINNPRNGDTYSFNLVDE